MWKTQWLSLACALAMGATACADSETTTAKGGNSAQGGNGGGGTGGTGDGGSGNMGGGGSVGPTFTCDDPVDIGGVPSGPRSDKVDILLVVDNSRSMADKQEILRTGVADLLGRFTNPRCVDASGAASATNGSTC